MPLRLAELYPSPRLAIFTLGGDSVSTSFGANCIALAGSAGTLVVDPLIAPAHARLVAGALARRGFPPVTHVVVTHHHTDHALGASFFARRDAVVIAQRFCAQAMSREHAALISSRRAMPALEGLFADAEPHQPQATFSEVYRIDLGDVHARALHLGPGHTLGDCVVLLPSESALVCGDLVLSGYHFNYEDAVLEGLPGALEALRALPGELILPGHGPAGGLELVEGQARYHREVAELVRGTATDDEARRAIRARYPEYLLEVAIASALLRLRRSPC